MLKKIIETSAECLVHILVATQLVRIWNWENVLHIKNTTSLRVSRNYKMRWRLFYATEGKQITLLICAESSYNGIDNYVREMGEERELANEFYV